MNVKVNLSFGTNMFVSNLVLYAHLGNVERQTK